LGEHAFSTSCRLLAAVSKKAIHIFDLVKGQEIRKLDDRGRANPFAFSPDNKLLLTAGDAIAIWSLATGKKIQSLPSAGIPVAVALSPDGKLLAQGNSWRSGLRLWDVETGQEAHRWPGHTGNVGSIVFSPDGNTVVSRSHEEKRLHFWEAGTGKELRVLSSDVADRRGDAGYGHAIAYSPDGRWLALGDLGGIVHIWDTNTGKVVRKLFIDNSRMQINALSFSRDGRTIAVSSAITQYDRSSTPGLHWLHR
jgi:WD40 repeat protein